MGINPLKRAIPLFALAALTMGCSQSVPGSTVPAPQVTLTSTAVVEGTQSAPMTATSASSPTQASAETATETTTVTAAGADVLGVSIQGSPGAYTMSVTVNSPDTGCECYADWWEVLTPEGSLIYRRVLDHSHSSEQPFTRSGGPVDIQKTDVVVVRAHMNTTAYAGAAMKGSVESGFATAPEITSAFFPELASASPQPNTCAF